MATLTTTARPIRVLVADDSNIFREALANFLADVPGVIVVGKARDGNEAVALVLSMRPDVVFMDVVMPNRDGLTATHMLKERANAPVVVVCTTHDDDVLRNAALDAGADAFVLKRDVAPEILKLLPRLVRALCRPDVACGGGG